MGANTSKNANKPIDRKWLLVGKGEQHGRYTEIFAEPSNLQGLDTVVQSDEAMQDELLEEYDVIEWTPVEDPVHRLIPHDQNVHFGCQHDVDSWTVADPKIRKKLEEKRLSRYPANVRAQFRAIWDELRKHPEIPHFQDLSMISDTCFQFTVHVNGQPPVYYRGQIHRDNRIEFKIFHRGY